MVKNCQYRASISVLAQVDNNQYMEHISILGPSGTWPCGGEPRWRWWQRSWPWGTASSTGSIRSFQSQDPLNDSHKIHTLTHGDEHASTQSQSCPLIKISLTYNANKVFQAVQSCLVFPHIRIEVAAGIHHQPHIVGEDHRERQLHNAGPTDLPQSLIQPRALSLIISANTNSSCPWQVALFDLSLLLRGTETKGMTYQHLTKATFSWSALITVLLELPKLRLSQPVVG